MLQGVLKNNQRTSCTKVSLISVFKLKLAKQYPTFLRIKKVEIDIQSRLDKTKFLHQKTTHLSTETIQPLLDIAQAALDNREHSDTELLQCRNRKLHLKFH